MKKDKNISIISISILVFLLYFMWPYLTQFILSILSTNNDVYLSFALNFVLLFIILFIYRTSLKKDLVDFKKNCSKHMKKGVKILLVGLICYVIANFIIGLISSFSGAEIDNFNVMYDTFKKIPILFFLSTTLYYPIIEEIVFKKTFKEIIVNKWFFVILTGFLNAGFNIALSITSLEGLIFIIPNAILSMSFSYIYYETNNLTTSVVYRALYNLIPNILAIISSAIIM